MYIRCTVETTEELRKYETRVVDVFIRLKQKREGDMFNRCTST
jgi:hypothetical protein